MALVSCDEDDSFEWADKLHAVSPSGSYVAYVQEAKEPLPLGSSEVWVHFRENGGGAHVIGFRGTGVPLKLRWLGPTTLEVRYPKDVSPLCDDDAVDHVVDCFGPKIRAVVVQI